MVNVIVSPGLIAGDGQNMHGGRVLMKGTVQREAEVINIIAQRIWSIAIE